MDSYTAKQRFFHKAQLIKPGEEILLNNAEAARLMFLGYISAPPKTKPKRVLRKKQNARFNE